MHALDDYEFIFVWITSGDQFEGCFEDRFWINFLGPVGNSTRGL